MGITKTTLVNDDFRVYKTTEDYVGVKCSVYRVDFLYRVRKPVFSGTKNNKKDPTTSVTLGDWEEKNGFFLYLNYNGTLFGVDSENGYEYEKNLTDDRKITPDDFIQDYDAVEYSVGGYSGSLQNPVTIPIQPDAETVLILQYVLTDGSNVYAHFESGTETGVKALAYQYRYTINYSDTPPVCEVVYPVGQTIDNHAPIVLQWTHKTDFGFPSYGYDLQYSYDGVVWNDLASVSPIGNTTPQPTNYTAPAYTFDVGVVYWRVRTYNTLDVASEWAVGSFIADSAPDAPVLQSVTTTPVPTIQWTSNEQAVFRVTIDNLFDSGVIYGTATSYTAPVVLPDGNHIVVLSIANASGRWTAATTSVETANTPSGSVALTGSVADMSAALSWTKTGSFTRLYLLRDGVPIKDITGLASTKDALFPGAGTYTVRGLITGGNYTDSNSVTLAEDAALSLSIVPLSAGNPVQLRYNLGASPQHDRSTSAAQEYTHYAGRALPVASLSGHLDVTHALNYAIDSANIHALSALVGKAVCIRDRYGRAFGVLESAQAKYGKRYTALTLSLTEIDYQEAVDYVV